MTAPETTRDDPETRPKVRNPFDPRAEKPIDPIVFGVALGIIVTFVILGAIFPDQTADISGSALDWVLTNFGWLFILCVAFFVAFTLYLALGRYGRIPLGKAGEKPEFSTMSWIALMYGGGMGVGLVFFGVAEPVSHMMEGVASSDADPGSLGAAREAMQFSFFHWGIQPWAIYSVVGLALAYSTYRKGRGNLLSSPFTPMIGDPENLGGKIINIFAIVVTKFGAATSLGLAGLQIAAGLSYVFDVDPTNTVTVWVIVVMTVAFVITTMFGLSKGMKIASDANLWLASALMLFVLVIGPTVVILNVFGRSLGDYMTNFLTMTFQTAGFADSAAADWLSNWTIFYWAWWVSWALHVGTFLARVSRGRTIRQFVTGAVLAPSLGSFVWFSIIGGTALDQQLDGVNLYAQQLIGGEAAGFFGMLQALPWFGLTGILAMVLVAIFFITGAHAGSTVLGTLSSHGTGDPRRALSAVWGVATSAVAIVLILVGGLDAIETFVILAATPFLVVMVVMALVFYSELRKDPLRQAINPPVRKHAPDVIVSDAVVLEVTDRTDEVDGEPEPPPWDLDDMPLPATTRHPPTET